MPVAKEAALNDLQDEVRGLSLRHVGAEPVPVGEGPHQGCRPARVHVVWCPVGPRFPAGLKALGPVPAAPNREAGSSGRMGRGLASMCPRKPGQTGTSLVATETRAHLVPGSGCPRGHLARGAGPVSGTATPVSAQDILEELDCLPTEAGQARVQHEGDQRDDSVHVGPGEGQGGR